MEALPLINSKPQLISQLSNFKVTREQVVQVLKDLRIDKSPGIDGIHPHILKELSDSISYPLSLIFQDCLKSGIIPQQWKDAIIAPIFKKGDRSLAKNYRPVSLTSVICKVLEKIIVIQISEHLKTNGLTCPAQHGFKAGHSTVTNLLEALNVWTEALMHRHPIDVIYLDYAKAFDTVPHQRLLRQIYSLGIQGTAIDFIRAFLTGRRQRVRVNKSYSTWKNVLSGVPQGSVLGPTLFTLYVWDAPQVVKCIVSMFADDTKLYTVLTDRNSNLKLNNDLASMQTWSSRMQMTFNIEKCKVLHLGNNNPNYQYTMPMSGEAVHTLEVTIDEKDLGVTIDNQLKFSMHVQTQVAKANRILGCLRHTFKYLTSTIFLQLYKAMIRPHLEYASCIWFPKLKRDSDAIERIQRRATKLVPALRTLTYTERLRQLKLPTLVYRRRRADMLQTYKIMHNFNHLDQDVHCPVCPQKRMLQQFQTQYTRGHNLKLYTQEAKGVRSNFFAARVIHDWNNLANDTVHAKSINIFKAKLRHEWMNHTELYNYTFSY